MKNKKYYYPPKFENLPGTGIDETFTDIEYAAIQDEIDENLQLIDLSKDIYKIIIAGSRTFFDYDLLKKECNNFIQHCVDNLDNPYFEIISGNARGADKHGEKYAKEYNYSCSVKPANWNKYGKRAGYLRNADMAQEADALIAFWDGKSRGTNHMIELAKQANLNVKVILYKDPL